jgi:hypothetical protein
MTDKLLEIETLQDWQIKQLVAREEVTIKNPKIAALDDAHTKDKDKNNKPEPTEVKNDKGLGGVVPEPPLAST